jgi:hypothetical protein
MIDLDPSRERAYWALGRIDARSGPGPGTPALPPVCGGGILEETTP